MDQPAFTATTEAALSHAGEICGARGVRLTELRRPMLGLILDKAAPVGAYEHWTRCATGAAQGLRRQSIVRWISCNNNDLCTVLSDYPPMSAAWSIATKPVMARRRTPMPAIMPRNF